MGLSKNLAKEEWIAIYHKLQDPNREQFEVRLNGVVIPSEKINKEISRYRINTSVPPVPWGE
jgi:hypothetical protein